MTNLDWLRSMSIDEWARLIYRYAGELIESGTFCKNKPECCGEKGCPDPDVMCPECVKEWLMEEHGDETD